MPRKAPTEPEIAVRPEAVALFQERMGMNDTEARAALGIGSPNTWVKYKAEGAPRTVALAMAALIRGLAPWPE